MNSADLRSLVNLIVKRNNLKPEKRYASYSLRIGATTTAHLKGISHPKILKYIGWSNSRLPEVAMRYIRFKPENLNKVPYEMIHGTLNSKNSKKNNLCQVFDPWNQRLIWDKFKK